MLFWSLLAMRVIRLWAQLNYETKIGEKWLTLFCLVDGGSRSVPGGGASIPSGRSRCCAGLRLIVANALRGFSYERVQRTYEFFSFVFRSVKSGRIGSGCTYIGAWSDPRFVVEVFSGEHDWRRRAVSLARGPTKIALCSQFDLDDVGFYVLNRSNLWLFRMLLRRPSE